MKVTRWMKFKNIFGFTTFKEWLAIFQEEFQEEFTKGKSNKGVKDAK